MSNPQRPSITDKIDQAKTGAPGTAVVQRKPDEVRQFVMAMQKEIAVQLPAHIPAEYFTRTIITGLRKSAALAKIAKTPRGRASIYAAMLEAARQGLMPFTEEGAIVPYGKEANWIPQWRGLVKQMFNTGQVSAVEARLIHRHDEWSLTYGDSGGFYHKPFLINEDGTATTAEQRGEPILAYCYVVLRDGSRTSVTIVTRSEAVEIMTTKSVSWKRAETSWDGEPPKLNSSWHTDFDAMWVKSAVRRNFRYAPSTPQLVELLLAAARDDTQRPPAADPPTLDELGVDAEIVEAEVAWDSDEDDGPEPPLVDLVPFDRPKQMRRLHAMLSECGVGDRRAESRQIRVDVCAMLARETATDMPAALKSTSELTDDELRRVIDKLNAIIHTDDGKQRPEAELRDGLALLATGAQAMRRTSDE